MKIFILISILLFIGIIGYSQDNDTKNSTDNKLEVKLAELEGNQNTNFKEVSEQIKSTEKLILSVERQFDRFHGLLYALLSFVAVIIGLIIWDRRSSLKPLEKEIRDLKDGLNDIKNKSENIERRIDNVDLP